MNQHFTKHLQASIKYEMRRYVSVIQLRNDKKRIICCISSIVLLSLRKDCIFMRKLFYFFLFGFASIACSSASKYHHQLEQVEAIIEDNPDSAKRLLEEIPSSVLNDGEERALYNLLLTMVDYKLYKPFTNDSLIRYSLAYYTQSGKKDRLATVCYYLGAINYEELKQKDVALHYLKKAEELTERNEEELLKNKLYELLHSINYNAQLSRLSLRYATLFLKSSKRIGNPELISRAYEHLSNDYILIGDDKKAAMYMKQSLAYADRCSDLRKSYIYGNYANYLMSKDQYEEAGKYLEIAVLLCPRPNHYIMLGKICKQEGDTLQARLYWEKAMTFDNQRFTVKAYKLLGEMYAEQHHYPLAFQMLEKADSVKDAWHEQMKTAQLTEIQQRYDMAIMEKALTERKNLWLTIATIALIILVLALIAVVYFSKKVREYKGIINEDIEHIYQAEQRIELLQSTGADSEHEVMVLKEQIERFKENSAQKLGRGKDIYEAITNGREVPNFSKAKELDFINYYAYTFNKKFHALILPYQKLTLRHTTYLVMQQMGLNDKKIAELLNVTDSTIRNYRYRLKLQK